MLSSVGKTLAIRNLEIQKKSPARPHTGTWDRTINKTLKPVSLRLEDMWLWQQIICIGRGRDNRFSSETQRNNDNAEKLAQALRPGLLGLALAAWRDDPVRLVFLSVCFA